MPLSLKNSIGIETYPYWFRLEGDNKCDIPVKLDVSWTFPKQQPKKPIIEPGDKARTLNIMPHEKWGKNYDLDLRPVGDEFDTRVRLTVDWTAFDERQIPRGGGSAEIYLYPPNVYMWNLIDPGGKTVEKDFVLASLANWVKTASDAVDDTVKKIESEPSTLANIGQWMEAAYSNLFEGKEQVVVSEGAAQFPPRIHLPIDTPETVLRRRQGNALEVALTLAAVTYPATEKGDQLALFILPSEGRKRYFLGWRDGTNTWRAIDAGAADSSFQVNRDRATLVLTRLIRDTPGLVDDIDNNGIYVTADATVLGLDFRAVIANAAKYKVEGLPIFSATETAQRVP